jgi:hypothetical protein
MFFFLNFFWQKCVLIIIRLFDIQKCLKFFLLNVYLFKQAFKVLNAFLKYSITILNMLLVIFMMLSPNFLCFCLFMQSYYINIKWFSFSFVVFRIKG